MPCEPCAEAASPPISWTPEVDHLETAHAWWRRVVRPGDVCVDATLGKGRDLMLLASLCCHESGGEVWGLDIHAEAVSCTERRLDSWAADLKERIHLRLQSHETFPSELREESVRLIAYNLGYYPDAHRWPRTSASSTVGSLQEASRLIQPGGVISCTCYVGHPGGLEEQAAVLAWAAELPTDRWSVMHVQWIQRPKGPTLLWIQRLEHLQRGAPVVAGSVLARP